ncbi:MAG: restriction endonuclease [Armatimonadota bacterium]
MADDEAFVGLCADLLTEEGFRNVRGRGKGPDQAKDLYAEVGLKSPLGESVLRLLVQCKHYRERPVGDTDISSSLSALSVHQVDAVLFMTSSHFSGTAVTKMNASRSPSGQPIAYYWDGEELTKRLWRRPWLITRHWQRGASGGTRASDRLRLSEEFSLPPRYKGLTLDEFPSTAANQPFMARMAEHAGAYARERPPVTVVSGGLGAGKTGYAASLANSLLKEDGELAYVCWSQFVRLCTELRNERESAMEAYALLSAAGCLIVDDVDINVTYHRAMYSEVDEFGGAVMMELIRSRTEGGRPTIVTVTDLRAPLHLVQSVAALALKWPHIHVGDYSLRGDDEQKPRPSARGCYLGKVWLAEKFERLNEAVERAMATLAMPQWQYEGEQNLIARTGHATTERSELVLQQLRTAIWENERYIDFINSLDFEHIWFHDDGSKTLL